MPQNMEEAIRALGGEGLSAQDYAGMAPKQMLGVSQALEQRRSNIAKEKLQALQTKVNAAVDKKKLQLQEERNKFLNEAKEQQTELSKKKAKKADIINKAWEELQDMKVAVSDEQEIDGATAALASQMGLPLGGDGGKSWSVDFQEIQKDGQTMIVPVLTSDTGDIRKGEPIGVAPPEDEEDAPRWKSEGYAVEKMSDAVNTSLGKSDLSGLDPKIRPQEITATKLGAAYLRNEREPTYTEAGKAATNDVLYYFEGLQDMTDAPSWGGNTEQIKNHLKESVLPTYLKMLTELKKNKANIPRQLRKSHIVNYLKDNKGYTDEQLGTNSEGPDVIDEAMKEYLNAQKQ